MVEFGHLQTWRVSIRLRIRWSLGIICTVVPTAPYSGGLKTGELVHTSQAKMGSGEDRRWVLEMNNHTRVQWRQDNCAEHGEDGKWTLCMHTCINTPHTHTHTHIWTAKFPGFLIQCLWVLSLSFALIFVQKFSIGQLSHTNPTPPTLWELLKSTIQMNSLPIIFTVYLTVVINSTIIYHADDPLCCDTAPPGQQVHDPHLQHATILLGQVGESLAHSPRILESGCSVQ